MIFLHKPLTIELTEAIAQLGDLVAAEEGLTPEEVRDLREFFQAVRAKHHAELREAERARIALRRAANVVQITDFMRAEQVYAGLPCDVEPKGAA
jgi:uncharacterized membrane protein